MTEPIAGLVISACLKALLLFEKPRIEGAALVEAQILTMCKWS